MVGLKPHERRHKKEDKGKIMVTYIMIIKMFDDDDDDDDSDEDR